MFGRYFVIFFTLYVDFSKNYMKVLRGDEAARLDFSGFWGNFSVAARFLVTRFRAAGQDAGCSWNLAKKNAKEGQKVRGFYQQNLLAPIYIKGKARLPSPPLPALRSPQCKMGGGVSYIPHGIWLGILLLRKKRRI